MRVFTFSCVYATICTDSVQELRNFVEDFSRLQNVGSRILTINTIRSWDLSRPGGLLQDFMRWRAISLANFSRRRNSPSGSRDNELAKLGLQVVLAERAATR